MSPISSSLDKDTQTGNRLRVAIIGYGSAGAVFHAPLVAATPGMQVSAIVTSNPTRQQQAQIKYPEARIYTHVNELWAHASLYDLVVVATSNDAHVELGLAALRADLPVVIDKPLAPSVQDAERLLEASKQSDRLLTVFQNRRWDNDFLTLQRLLASDTLGAITRYESRFDRYRAAPREGAWRESADPAMGGGLLYDLGSHIIDQALVLFGPPLHVYAEMDKRRPGAQVDDDTFVALRFANGIQAHFWMSLVARMPGARLRVSGLRGTYEKWGLDPQEDALRAGQKPGDPGWGLEPRERWGHLSTDIGAEQGVHFDGQIETLPGAYEQYYAQVRDALLTGAPVPVALPSVIATLHVLEAAQQSAQTGQIVTL